MPDISEKDLQRLRASVEELTALNEIATEISLSKNVDSITRIILDHCLKRIAAAQGAVFLLEDDSGDTPLFRTFVRETAPASEASPLHLNWSLLGWMTKNKRQLVVNDPAGDARFSGIDFAELEISSLLAAPLIAQSGLIGVLVLFNKQASSGFTNEDKRFLGIVGTQTSQVIENARLYGKERELIALEEERTMAKEIQDSYLPRSGRLTEHYEILGFNHPAKEVGGDYFDMFAVGDHEAVLSIGDVAGKGIPAALLASEAQAVIRSLLRHNPLTTLPELTVSLNNLFVEMTRPEQYTATFLATYDSRDGLLKYVNGGHNPPLIVSSDGEVTTLEGADLLVGAFPDSPYSMWEYELSSGDLLFLYTDGITENFDPRDTQYGEERLRSFLQRHHQDPLSSIRDKLVAELAEFRQEAPQSDDITFLMLRTS